MAGSLLNRLQLVQTAIAELDAVIVEACRPWAHQLELLQTDPRGGPKVAQAVSILRLGHPKTGLLVQASS